MTLAKDVSQKFVFAILPKSNAKNLHDGRFDLVSKDKKVLASSNGV